MLTAPVEEEVAPTPSIRRPTFRGDVDGLRAVAILLVCGYHAGLPSFDGGFTGVDVFFVISGFLISRNLLRDAESEERISLSEFWARRVRRLVPALALVVGVTLVASFFLMPLYLLDDVARQGSSAALYLSNFYFADQAQDYFATDLGSSPFLHTWSLGVEEQFYVVWPVLVALVCVAVRRGRSPARPARRRWGLVGVFSITLVASLAVNLHLTAQGSSWAFFGLPARAWEFAVAGLLAVVPVPGVLRGVGVRTALGVAGLATIGAGLLVIDDRTLYPGLWALFPVVGTVLVIVAGETWNGTVAANPVSTTLALRPMQWVGRVSYSWYLWHWPAMVLAVTALDSERTLVRTAAVAASLPVAAVAYRWFETPIRFAPVLTRSKLRTFGLAGGVTVCLLSLSLVVRPGDFELVPVDSIDMADLEAPPGSSLEERLAVTVAVYEQRSENSCPVDALLTADDDHYCVGGDPNGSRTLMLMGDSHAGQWRRPLEAIASTNGIRLLIRQHNGCPPFMVQVAPSEDRRKDVVCARQQEGDLRVLDRLAPDAVIVATRTGGREILGDDGEVLEGTGEVEVWESAVEELYEAIRSRGIELGVILDEPTLPISARRCLAAENSIEACEVPRDEAFAESGPLLEAERRVIDRLGGIAVLDAAALICDEEACRMEEDGTLTYLDAHHITDAFAVRQLPLLEDLVAELFS